MSSDDFVPYMKECLKLAQEAALADEVPVGAVVVHDGKIIGHGKNSREFEHSVLGHAELQAIAMASKHLQSWRLNNCTLVTTLEPCVMCAGAIVQSRIAKVVFGAPDEKGGGHTLFGILNSAKLNHRIEVIENVLREEAGQLLKEFFKQKRG